MTTLVRICPVCGDRIINPGAHLERCTGTLPVRELARLIVSGGAFTDRDAVRVARAFLDEDEAA